MEAVKNEEEKIVTFEVPEDPDLLAAVGKLAIVHTHHEHALVVLIKILTRVSIDEAVNATTHDGVATLRKRILKLSRRMLEDGTTLIKLQSLLERSRQISDERNKILHRLWAKEIPLGWIESRQDRYVIRHEDLSWNDVPSVSELEALIEKTDKLLWELIFFRDDIDDALIEDEDSGNA